MLAPLFQGDWTPLGEMLACATTPPAAAIRMSDLLDDPVRLHALLLRHGRHHGVRDLRPIASVWSLHYLWALLPPVVAATSVLAQALPVRLEDVAVEFDDDAEPVRIHLPHEGRPALGADTATRYAPLLWAHLQPLFTVLGRHARLPQKILWANTARYLDPILGHAARLTGGAPSVLADQDQLLVRDTWPDGRANPLHGRPRHVTQTDAAGRSHRVALYHQCCLYYLMPDEGYCGGCPLSPENRACELTTAAPGV